MKPIGRPVLLGTALVVLSALFYLLHYALFRDAHHIFLYLVGDVAFVFIEVLLVTLVIHGLLTQREKRAVLEKLNMVIGTFFSEVGTELLARLSDFDPQLDPLIGELTVTSDWSDRDFDNTSNRLRTFGYEVEGGKVDLEDLRRFLTGKRDFLLRLLENPNLLEHETFTDLLRAVFHLTQELAARGDCSSLPQTDRGHLVGDMKRVYSLLVFRWLDYMRHLKANYPYLFSLAMRTNPFDQQASPILK